MTTRPLLDAVRRDMRSRLGVIQSLRTLDESVDIVSQTIDDLHRETSDAASQGPTAPYEHLTPDLLTLRTVVQDLIDRVADHRRAVEAALFGDDRPEHNT